MWLLESTPDSPSTLLFRLLPGSIKTVGRAPRADFVVDAPLVSRLHCRLTLQSDGPTEITRRISSVLNPSAIGRRTPGSTTTS